jgi:hypothetical protein
MKAISTVIAATAALMLSGGAYAQANNTLATPSVVSPAAATTSSGYGAPGATNSDSGTGAGSANATNNANNGAATVAPAYGGNNTLATPSTASPAAAK